MKALLKEWIKVATIIIVASFFGYQTFKIPSESMKPTLLVGDFIVVNKYCYGYSQDTFRIGTINVPFLNFKGRIFSCSLPQRGDVVVFRNEKDKNQNYIKRIIGLPGDTIQLKGGIVHINGEAAPLVDDGEYSDIENGEYFIQKKYIEQLPNGVNHVIIKREALGKGRLDNVGPYQVPLGHYFLMGDNRDNSQDSRVLESVGYIPIECIMGRADLIFFSSSCSWWEILKWPFSARYERILTQIK
ncbi:MAG: signal peptidase I [Holosporales bacterium]|nr:signal peptidase I [Holosporales bacterium]